MLLGRAPFIHPEHHDREDATARRFVMLELRPNCGDGFVPRPIPP
jgi:hypothetical protein